MLRMLQKIISPTIKVIRRDNEQLMWRKADKQKLDEFLRSPTGTKLTAILEDRIIYSTLTAQKVDEKFREGMVSVYGQLRALAQSREPAEMYPSSVHQDEEGGAEDRAFSENPVFSETIARL